MGFSEQASRSAVRNYPNDFESALDALLRGEFNHIPPEPPVADETVAANKTVTPELVVKVETI